MPDNPNVFLKLTGIEGESQADKHEKEIDISSFSWGLTQQGSAGVAGGAGTNRSDFHDMSFSKYTDKSSPTLAMFCATGKVIDEAVLSMNKAGGDDVVEYEKITLKNSIISSFQQSGGGGTSSESFSLNFAEIKVESKLQTDTGTSETGPEFSYDVKMGKKV